jgi:catecholate siderophore receptor
MRVIQDRLRALGVATMAATMLTGAGSAFAAEAAEAAAEAAGDEGPEIVVVGRGEEVDLATLRGAVIDLPQTINIVDEQVLKDRQVTTLADALRNVAGVTTSVGEGGVVSGDQFFIRGQSARDDIFTDGLRDFGAFTRDSFNYESVQVLKGSSSTALGRGVSGGAINTQSKRAKAQDAFSATVSGGSDNYGRLVVDANKALGPTTGLRLNFMAHTNDTPDRDHVTSRRWGGAASLGLGLGTDTSFHLVYFHQEERKTVDYGVPIAQTSSATDIEMPVTELGVPRSNYYGFRGDDDDTVVNTLTGRFSHKFSDTLSLTSDLKLGVYERAFRQTVPACNAACGDALTDGNPATVPVMTASARGQFRQTTKGVQNVTTLLVEAPIAGMRNELIVGWDISHQTNRREDDIRANGGTSVSQPLLAPSLGLTPLYPNQVFQLRHSKATDLSFFIDERLWLTPELSINAGVRYQHFTSDQDLTELAGNAGQVTGPCNGVAVAAYPCLTRISSTSDLWSPKVSAIWEPSPQVSLYASWSRAAVPAGNSVSNASAITVGGGSTITAADLAPERTETFDLGAKASLFGNRLLVQAALYQIDRNNARETDPGTNLVVASSDPKQRLRGFEIGLSGTVTPDLLITANYSYVDAEILEAYTSGVLDVAAIGKRVRYVPAHSLSLWGSYKPLEGGLAGLELGLGATYQSEVYLNNTNTQAAPSFFAVDALVGYNFGRFRLAVNGYNLTDKRYYAQVNGGRVVPAAGRSVVASLGLSF